jgi:DNA-binding response OmpR family regulator/tetratricopeptide (TPR) repeat protein
MAATILCVDDDRHLCRILEKALVREGFKVLTAHDGDEALERLETAKPSLILLDVLLPRRDGFEVLESLRARSDPGTHVPVLMMTGCRVTPQYKERAASLGASAILAKPVPLDTLLARVREQLKEAPPRVASAGRKAAGTAARKPAARKPARGKAEPMRGSFRELGFPHLLHHLHGLRATGVLMLSNGKKRKAVQMRDGYPVAVKSNLMTECLGNLLVKRGVIDEAALQESLRRVKEGEGLQGQILVAMQVFSEDELVRVLREQAEQKLFEVFTWRRGQFQFEIGGRLKRGSELALEESPANLILRGVRDYMPMEQVDAFLQQRADRFLVAGENPFYRHQDIDLDDAERKLLAGLGAGRPLAPLLRKKDEGLRRTLFGLIATEMIDLREGASGQKAAPDGTPAAAKPAAPDPGRDRELRTELAARAERLRGMSYYEMLGVSPETEPPEISAAFDEQARQFHPDRFATASSAVRQLADQVHQLIARAHETLVDPKRRREYEVERKRGERQAAQRAEGRRALDAEIEFQKGEANLRSRDYEIALRYFGEALSKYPEEGEYHAHYGWCLHLCHPDDPTIAQEAIEHAKRGAKLARDREKPFLFLGRLYKVVGKNGMAERMFTRAVQIRPDCVEAMRELRLINLRREKSKGIVRRLLRR